MTRAQNHAGAAIAFVLFGVFCISLNDMLIKRLSSGYPLHQIVFFRSFIALLGSLVFLQFEGGLRALRTDKPLLHLLRGVLVVISNMAFFLALAVIPLADATALFFAAPLFITLLSIPILGERVGPLRLGAVTVGFVGVIIMQRPWEPSEALAASRLVLALPVLAALTYALNQLMTRKLGVKAPASALAIYIQATFLAVSILFYLIAGDGRFALSTTNASLDFLLRAWVRPAPQDQWVLLGMGINGAFIGYCLSQAYPLRMPPLWPRSNTSACLWPCSGALSSLATYPHGRSGPASPSFSPPVCSSFSANAQRPDASHRAPSPAATNLYFL